MFGESRPETELSEEPPLPHVLVTMVDTNCPHQFPWIPQALTTVCHLATLFSSSVVFNSHFMDSSFLLSAYCTRL